jgi:hypothetical protein
MSGKLLHVAVGFSGRALLPAPVVVVFRIQEPIRFLVQNRLFGISRVPLLLNGFHIPALAQYDRIALVERLLLDYFLLDSNGPVLIAFCLLGLALADCGLDAV